MIHLKTPLSKNDVKTLKAGDQVLISGRIYTARDQAHARLKDEKNLAINLEGSVIYYVGPTPEKPGYIIGSSGPTSSYRMDELAVPLMEKGVVAMIGKGERSDAFIEAMQKHRAVYFMATGGAGALLASKIKSSRVVMYDDLDAEAVRELEVEDFPCYVAYDIHGGNLFKHD